MLRMSLHHLFVIMLLVGANSHPLLSQANFGDEEATFRSHIKVLEDDLARQKVFQVVFFLPVSHNSHSTL